MFKKILSATLLFFCLSAHDVLGMQTPSEIEATSFFSPKKTYISSSNTQISPLGAPQLQKKRSREGTPPEKPFKSTPNGAFSSPCKKKVTHTSPAHTSPIVTPQKLDSSKSLFVSPNIKTIETEEADCSKYLFPSACILCKEQVADNEPLFHHYGCSLESDQIVHKACLLKIATDNNYQNVNCPFCRKQLSDSEVRDSLMNTKNTILFFALFREHNTESLKLYINRFEANFQCIDCYGQTILHRLLQLENQNLAIEILRKLPVFLTLGHVPDHYSETPIELALRLHPRLYYVDEENNLAIR